MDVSHAVAPERPFDVFEPTAGEPFDTRQAVSFAEADGVWGDAEAVGDVSGESRRLRR